MKLKDQDPESFREYVDQIQTMMTIIGVASVLEVVEGAAEDFAARASAMIPEKVEMWSSIAYILSLCAIEVSEVVEGCDKASRIAGILDEGSEKTVDIEVE